MAFSLDTSLGASAPGLGNVSSFTLTTTAAAASGALIVVGFGAFSNAATGTWSASGGSLTWTVPVVNGTGSSTDLVGLAWALAPSGLASSTVITVSCSTSNVSAPGIAAMSFLGSATSSPQDGTSSKTYASITSGVWTGNSVTLTGSSDLVVAAGWGDGQTSTTTGDTASGGYTGGPLASQTGATGGVITLVYVMNVSSSGTPGGTWSTGQPTGTAVVAAGFLASGGGAAAGPRPRFNAIPFMAPQGM